MISWIKTRLKSLPSTEIRPPAWFSRLDTWVARKTFFMSERRHLYEQLAFLLDNKSSLKEAITKLQYAARQKGKERSSLMYCLSDIHSALTTGQTLDKGLSPWVPHNESTIIMSARLTGDLSNALKRTIQNIDTIGKLKSKVISSQIYPVFLCMGTLVAMHFLNDKYIPTVLAIIPREALTGKLALFVGITEFFVSNMFLLLSAIALTIISILWTMPNLTGKVRNRVLDRLFPWSVYKETEGATFLLNYAALMHPSIRMEQALHLLCVYASPWLFERLDATRRKLSKGVNFGQALLLTGFNFPSRDAAVHLSILSGGNDAQDLIKSFASFWQAESLSKITKTCTVVNFVILLFNASYIVLQILASVEINALVKTLH